MAHAERATDPARRETACGKPEQPLESKDAGEARSNVRGRCVCNHTLYFGVSPVKNYKIRYMVENWDKPTDTESDKDSIEVRPGVVVSGNDYGYADRLFLASFVEQGNKTSVLLLDTVEGPHPSRETLERVRDAINHHIEHHCE